MPITATAKRSFVVLRERGSLKTSIVFFSSKFEAAYAARLFADRGHGRGEDLSLATVRLEGIRQEGR